MKSATSLMSTRAFLMVGLIVAGMGGDVSASSDAITVSTLTLPSEQEFQSLSVVIEQLEELVAHQPEQDLVVTPMMPFLSFASETQNEDLTDFCRFAKVHSTWLSVALTEKSDQGMEYWTAVLVDREGQIVGKYRKSHRLADDAEILLGDTLPVFETDFGRVGLTIGTDFYFPEIYIMLAQQNADVITWQHFPEPVRDHSTWRTLLMARALDNKTPLVTAHYADSRPYLTANASMRRRGSCWGRSQVINRVGVAIADTGFDTGAVSALLSLESTKTVHSHDADPRRDEGIFFVTNNGGRQLFEELASPAEAVVVPKYSKRKIRIAMVHSDRDGNWVKDHVPKVMLSQIDEAAAFNPDVVLLSEMQTDIVTDEARKTLAEISRRAKSMNSYIIMAGVDPTGNSGSVAWVWDRQGKVVQQKPIYWPRGHMDSEVLDTDFGRIGIHVCGDLHLQELDRILAIKGAEIIFDPTMAWGPDGETNLNLAQARAADNGMWLAVGHWNQAVPRHRTWLVDPYGQTLMSSPYNKSGVMAYEIDLDNARKWTTIQRDERKKQNRWSDVQGGILTERDGWREMVFAHRRPGLYTGIGQENLSTGLTGASTTPVSPVLE